MFQSSIDSKCSQDWRDSMRRLGKKLQCDLRTPSRKGAIQYWDCDMLRFYFSKIQNINTNTDPILRLRHAQILLFTPFFLRNICNEGWIWLLWKENVAIRISFHLSLEVEGFNLYNLQTYCESSTPLVKSLPDLGLKRGCRKGKRIGCQLRRDEWSYMYILYPKLQKKFWQIVKGRCWFGVWPI